MDQTSPDQSSALSAEAELVASLFATRVPTAVMSLLFLVVGGMVAHGTADALLPALVIAGMLASVVRLVVIAIDGRLIVRPDTTDGDVRVIERRFATSYLAFATLLGLFCARALMVAPVEHHVLVGVLVVGYAAGVAAGVTLRPRIAVTAIGLAVVPTALAAAFVLHAAGLVLAGVLLAFVGGALRSMQMRYHSETSRITLRRTYELLARQDHLTRIANRLGLEQHFQRISAARGGGDATGIAVHCMDLDRFKQVNDQHGHDIGDGLLVAVAGRLRGFAPGAIAARLGGDEFVLVQFGLKRGDHVARAARRLEDELLAPYVIEGIAMEIGVSVGTAFGDRDTPLHDLLRRADLCQRQRKLERREDRCLAAALPVGRVDFMHRMAPAPPR